MSHEADRPSPGRSSRASRRGLIAALIGAGVLVLGIVGVNIAVSQLNEQRDPAIVVREYLDLIAAGEAEAASAMVDPGASEGAVPMLGDDVLGAALERIEVVSVETATRTSNGARVTATMRLAGQEFEHEFTVDHGPKEWLWLDTWVLEDPLVFEVDLVNLDGTAPEVRIGETLVELTGGSASLRGTVRLYPGVYQIDGPADVYFTAASQPFKAVLPFAYVDVHVETVPTDALRAEVLRQVHELTEQCISPETARFTCVTTLREEGLVSLEVLEPASGIEWLTRNGFQSTPIVFGMRDEFDDPAGRPIRVSGFMRGFLEWRNGEPVLVEYLIMR